VSLQKIPVSWPLTGGLDTKKSPLAIQPGSHLTLDNVIQERLNEWRRRNGFTNDSLDSLPSGSSFYTGDTFPYFVGNLGDAGMFAQSQALAMSYYPSVGAGSPRWAPYGSSSLGSPPASHKRMPLVEIGNGSFPTGFTRLGNVALLGTGDPAGGAANPVYAVDVTNGVPRQITTDALVLRWRGASTSTHLVMFAARSDGSLLAYVIPSTMGAMATYTVKAAGGHATAPYLDAVWYGGATITVVVRTAADAVRHLEFNPATGAVPTDVATAGISCANALSLLVDPDSSGVRFIANSHTTPTTRVTRVSSAGAVLTNDQVEAVASTQITGVASSAGANYNVAYQIAAPSIRLSDKTGGVVGTPADLLNSSQVGVTLDSVAWRDNAGNFYNFLAGFHSTNVDDPQDSWVEMRIPLGTPYFLGRPVSAPEPLAAGKTVGNASLFQVTKTGSRQWSAGLPVQVIYEDNAGTIVRHYSVDLFEWNQLTGQDIAAMPTQKPVTYKQTVYLPGAELSYVENEAPVRHGLATPPRAVISGSSSTAAGTLTGGAEYGYVLVAEMLDNDGNIWRSPPSAPWLITLGALHNTVQFVWALWPTDTTSRRVRVGIYRTAANGSSYRRIATILTWLGGAATYTDLAPDSAIVDGEVLYTQGELATAITPPPRAVWMHDDRLWAINAEYPTEAWYTKNLRPGRQPEFTNEGIVDQDDEFGDLTNGASLDTQNVLFKKNAIYFGTGDGFTDSGSGTNYHFDRIDTDQGALPGSPLVNTGKVLYFVGERGIHTVDKQGVVVFMDAVDQFLHQPLVQTPETVYDGCFVSTTNEVVFVTTNYLLIHNITFNYWRRVTGLSGMRRCVVIAGRLVLFRNDGTVWREGDQTQLTDQGAAFVGTIRSPWMRPTQGSGGPGTGSTATAGQQGLRLYRGRVTYTRTSGGASVKLLGRIYRNNDDAQVEQFLSGAVSGAVLSGTGEMVPRNQKCTSFSLELVLPTGDCTVRVDGFSAIIGTREGALVTDQGSRWK